MKKNIKDKIKEEARKLFNEKGYNSVSMRDISNNLNISVGNLTYHFNKKEDLIEAIVIDMYDQFEPSLTPTNLMELDSFFTDMLNSFESNAYYFWHYTQLSQISENIKKLQISMLDYQFAKLQNVFDYLLDDKILLKEVYPSYYDNLIYSILNISIYWFPYNKLSPDKIENQSFRRNVWSLIYPNLTKKGVLEYKKSIAPIL